MEGWQVEIGPLVSEAGQSTQPRTIRLGTTTAASQLGQSPAQHVSSRTHEGTWYW
jgi:hypothetical protein